MSVPTADLLLHSPIWTYDSVATYGAVGKMISVIGALDLFKTAVGNWLSSHARLVSEGCILMTN